METESTSTSKTTASQQCDPECSSIPTLHHQKASLVLPMRRRSFQRVHFAPLVSKDSATDSKNVFPSPHKTLTDAMIHETWYTRPELETFQRRTKFMVLLTTKYPTLDESKLNESSKLGLERHNPKRVAYKRAAIQFTLEAQQKTKDPNYVAAVAQKCSIWAKKAAFHVALQTYCDVYHSASSRLIRLKSRSITDYKDEINTKASGTKRSLSEGKKSESSPNKRRRIARSA
ncbi:MAG: hypothetical protein SGBAC_012140 [Bacillariaceae sp.]